tara:strand:- start:51 stop:206 length:156 start_codon:yes stop_codon:yes gene_type:complete
MTRKHFKLAASIIAKENNLKVRSLMAQMFIEVAREFNSNFNTSLFLTACNL